MNNIELVNKIKFFCNSQNLKISALLKKAVLSPNIIDDWQNNKTEPSFPALLQICNVLQIQLKDLFKTEDLSLTVSQSNILAEWKTLGDNEKRAVFDYITALKSNHK